MLDILSLLEKDLLKGPPLKSSYKKLLNQTYLSPSSSMCYTYSGEPLGSCIKQVWLDIKKKPISKKIDSSGIYVAESGNIWEAWLIERYKSIGIYLDDDIALIDNELQLSGKLDILHINPETGDREVTEVKTYSSSSYYATKGIMGFREQIPRPKDDHLLQSIKYLMMLKEYDIHVVNIVYLDRACKSFFNNKQFKVYLEDDEIFYETYYRNELIRCHIDTFNIQSLKEKDSALLQLIELDFVPDPDYKISYTLQDVEEKYRKGELTKKAYESVTKSNTDPSTLSDWRCIAENTSIQTSLGFKNIQEIKEGEFVFTRTGYEKVLKSIDSGLKNIGKLKVFNNLDLLVTPDHEILSSFHKDHNTKKLKLPKNIDFRKVEDLVLLKNPCIVYKIDRTVVPIELSDDEIFILAAFISEGSYKEQYRNDFQKIYTCTFTLSQKELSLAERIRKIVLKLGATSVRFDFKEDSRPINNIKNHSLSVVVYGVEFINWLRSYITGHFSYNKVFNKNICLMEPEKQLALASYCCLFDGCLNFKATGRNTILDVVSTTCKEKALQLQQFYFRNNKIASLQYVPQGSADFGSDKTYTTKEAYHVRYYHTDRPVSLLIDDFIYIRIREFELLNEPVQCYDLSVENSHEFQTQTGIVHNCRYCKFGKNKETGFSTCIETQNG